VAGALHKEIGWISNVPRVGLSALVVVASLLAGGCASGSSPGSKAVLVLPSDSATGRELTGAFDHWELLPPTCSGEIVDGTVRIARAVQTGVSWATAHFQPVKGCYGVRQPPGITSPTVVPNASANEIPPWSDTYRPIIAVFERQPGGTWTMNNEAGVLNGKVIFPCTVAGGAPPGQGGPAVPAMVIAAWHMTAKPPDLCANQVVALEPR
jgi:hypothetical protein